MLQHLLRRLVFDVPILNEYAKMPLKVWGPLDILKLLKTKFSFGIHFSTFTFILFIFLRPTAFDQSLWAVLEVLLPP